MAHANARLTPAGRLTWSGGSPPNRDGRSPTSPTSWASLAPPPTAGGAATSSSARLAWSIGPASPGGVRGGPLPGWRSGSSGCAGASGSARPASPPGSTSPPPPSIGSWSATG
jgi:hypothetical protein